MEKTLINVDETLVKDTSRLAQSIFVDYYNNLIGNAQATYMANLFLSEEAVKEELNKGTIFKLLKVDGNYAGFIEYKNEGERVFLSKFYVHKDYRHKGLGSYEFNDVKEYALSNNIHKIYLTVNKENEPSISIYRHLGFVEIDKVKNDIGNGYYMDDYILELTF